MTHYAHTYPKARKPHRCEDCGRTIDPGETYRRGAGIDGGTAWTWKECAHCCTLVHLLWWGDSEGYGQETFDEWEPETVGHLRLKALWRKKWRRKDGGLYPIPTRVIEHDGYGFGHVVDVVLADTDGEEKWP